jgi:glycosyltransferase involved in cell wall biosynthesis
VRKVAVLYSGGRHWGGIETYLANLFRLHDRHAIELILISMGEWDLTRGLEREGFTPMIRVLAGKRVRLGTLKEVRRIIRDERIELIVSQGTVANAYARTAALFAGAPSLVVVHSDMMLDYPRITRWAYTLSDRLLRPLTKRYVAVSRDLKAKMVKSGVKDEKVTVIYNGVNAAGRMQGSAPSTVSSPASAPDNNVELGRVFGQSEAVVSIVTVGRLHPVKNFDGLIKAMPLLPSNVLLTIWGEGKEKAKITALVEELDLAARVRLPGESKNMEEALASADIYVQPSKSEGCSFAVAEAMLCGKPVVVTPCGGLPEQVDNGMTGLVAQDCSPEALAEALRVLVTDRALAVALGDAGRKEARERFSMQRWLEKTTATLCDTARGDTW